MRVPELWLREFCNPDLTTQQLEQLLTMGGFEVEQVELTAPQFSNVVVAQIIDAKPHPDADRLRVCTVDVGQEQLQIVCGAPNARAGIKIPCALVGAKLPPAKEGESAFNIKVGKLRGVQSYGMLCSHKELGIAGDYPDGILELPSDAPVGQDIRSYLKLDEAVFDIKLTPNLSHAISIYGLAREISALTGAQLKNSNLPKVAVATPQQLTVKIADEKLCSRFSSRIITDLNAKVKTPDWMVRRLVQCGMRSVNILADISNYVMLEYGQPTHFFDLDKIGKNIQVRWAKPGEKCTLLNGKEVILTDDIGVVADQEKVLAVAGIMGSENSSVNEETNKVLIEAAHWRANAIMGRARRLNFSSESSFRFERGVDPALTKSTLERITALVVELCGGKVAAISDVLAQNITPKKIGFRPSRARKIIGMPIDTNTCIDIFHKLGFSVSQHGEDLEVVVPTYRFDIQIEEDLVEEVIRIIGYDKIPNKTPVGALQSVVISENKKTDYQIRQAMVSLGYQETINYSFVDEKWEQQLVENSDPIRVINPIASQMSVMRSSLIGSLINTLKYNVDRKVERVKLFEIGAVFSKDPSVKDTTSTVAGFKQSNNIAAIFYGTAQSLNWQAEKRWVDFFDLKGELQTLLAHLDLTFIAGVHPALHPGRSADIFLGKNKIGIIGELHPKWLQEYSLAKPAVLFELDYNQIINCTLPSYKAISAYPPVFRDIAIVVPDKISYEQVLNTIKQTNTANLLAGVVLFDIYKIKTADDSTAEKSLAIRLTLSSNESTLNEQQIHTTVQSVIKSLEDKLNAKLRV